jgi:hypothetical protein
MSGCVTTTVPPFPSLPISPSFRASPARSLVGKIPLFPATTTSVLADQAVGHHTPIKASTTWRHNRNEGGGLAAPRSIPSMSHLTSARGSTLSIRFSTQNPYATNRVSLVRGYHANPEMKTALMSSG